jgi:hypothetical protein
LRERVSLRNIAPAKAVKIGVMKVSTVTSDNDKYSREKYNPEIEKNL